MHLESPQSGLESPTEPIRENGSDRLEKPHRNARIAALGSGLYLLIYVAALGGALRARPSILSTLGRWYAQTSVAALISLALLVPIVAHSIWGIATIARAKLWRKSETGSGLGAATPNANAKGKSVERRLREFNQLTGIVGLAFVVYHEAGLLSLRWSSALFVELWPSHMLARLSSTWQGLPIHALVYTVGTFALIAHVVLSILSAYPTLRSRSLIRSVLVFAGGALFVLSFDSIVVFTSGKSVLGLSPDTALDIETSPCHPAPAPSAQAAPGK